MQQHVVNSNQQTSANILIQIGGQYVQFSAFHYVLSQIVSENDITVPNLAPPFNGTYLNKLLMFVTLRYLNAQLVVSHVPTNWYSFVFIPQYTM